MTLSFRGGGIIAPHAVRKLALDELGNEPIGALPGDGPVTDPWSHEILTLPECAEADFEFEGSQDLMLSTLVADAAHPRYPHGQGNGRLSAVPASVYLSAGQPLDTHVASEMASAFGHSFADVRIHTDGPAARSAVAFGADAFTVANHIAFGAGKYQPRLASGIRLLAHELTHVVQQRGREAGPRQQFFMSTPDDAGEREADNAAETMMTAALSGFRVSQRRPSRAMPCPTPGLHRSQ
jgi:hypothetical protein